MGNIVNVIGDFDDTGCCRVSNDKHFIVVEPDTLLSGTSVVSSIHCMRRSLVYICCNTDQVCASFVFKILCLIGLCFLLIGAFCTRMGKKSWQIDMAVKLIVYQAWNSLLVLFCGAAIS